MKGITAYNGEPTQREHLRPSDRLKPAGRTLYAPVSRTSENNPLRQLPLIMSPNTTTLKQTNTIPS